MFAYAFGEKQLLRDHAFSQFLCILREVGGREVLRSRMSLSHLDP